MREALDAVKLAVLGILFTIGLTVGFGLPAPVLVRVLAGVAAPAVVAILFRWPPTHKVFVCVGGWPIRK